jgi:hypothetical protein
MGGNGVVCEEKYCIMDFAKGNVIGRYILNLCNTEEKEYMQGWLNESQYNRFIYNHIAQSLNEASN